MEDIEEIENNLREELDGHIQTARKDADGSTKDFIGFMIVRLDDMKLGLESEYPELGMF